MKTSPGPAVHHQWIAACGGTEVPFTTRTGHRLHYMFCPATGEHAYYDCTNDIFVTGDHDSMVQVGLIW